MKLWHSILVIWMVTSQTESAKKFGSLFGKCKPKTKSMEEETMMYTPLLQERYPLPIKLDFEAELAFATMSLGFVEVGMQHERRVIDLVADYTKLERGNQIKSTTFESDWPEGNHLTPKQKSCIQYLNEPVLAENYILYDRTADPSSCEFVEKQLEFEYYAREEIPIVKVLKCPITFHRTEKKFLYFSKSGRNIHWPAEERDYYFVMHESPDAPHKLTVLMLTQHQPKTRNNQSREVMQLRADPNVPKNFIRLTVPQNRMGDYYRLFGMDAERAYISVSNFFFLNYEPDTWVWIDQLIKFVDIVKKGSEIDFLQESRAEFEQLEVDEKKTRCEQFVRGCRYLLQRDISINREAKASKIKITKNIIKFSHLNIPDQYCFLMRCPVIFNNSGILSRQTGYVYFKTVPYRDASKQDLYTFVLMNPPTSRRITYIQALSEIMLYVAPTESTYWTSGPITGPLGHSGSSLRISGPLPGTQVPPADSSRFSGPLTSPRENVERHVRFSGQLTDQHEVADPSSSRVNNPPPVSPLESEVQTSLILSGPTGEQTRTFSK